MSHGNRYDAIYVSPHLDDAVLSCGGQMAARTRRGESVLVYTLAAGDPGGRLSPFAAALHDQWGLQPDASARRAEDERACALLGVEHLHSEEPDCLYRRHPQSGEALYTSLKAVFGAPHADDTVCAVWEKTLCDLPAAEMYFAPLAVGGHVDHQLARRAAETAFGRRIRYYEDYPYCGKRMALVGYRLRFRQWAPEAIPLSGEDVAARCRAGAAYASQVDMLFNGRHNLERRIRGYIRRVGGERVWKRL